MIELVLVRHGQPDWEPDGRAVDEPGLTSLGREQAECVAEALADQHFDHAYASTLRRAAETAAPVARRLGRELECLSWLEEMRPPTLEGRTPEEVQEFFASASLRDLDRWWDGLPGGESFRHFYERITGGVEDLLTVGHGMQIHANSGFRIWQLPPEDQRILIVSHQGTAAVILSHLLGIEPVPWAWIRFTTAWAAVSAVRTEPVANGHVWVLDYFNRSRHLAGLPESGRSA